MHTRDNKIRQHSRIRYYVSSWSWLHRYSKKYFNFLTECIYGRVGLILYVDPNILPLVSFPDSIVIHKLDTHCKTENGEGDKAEHTIWYFGILF